MNPPAYTASSVNNGNNNNSASNPWNNYTKDQLDTIAKEVLARKKEIELQEKQASESTMTSLVDQVNRIVQTDEQVAYMCRLMATKGFRFERLPKKSSELLCPNCADRTGQYQLRSR